MVDFFPADFLKLVQYDKMVLDFTQFAKKLRFFKIQDIISFNLDLSKSKTAENSATVYRMSDLDPSAPRQGRLGETST